MWTVTVDSNVPIKATTSPDSGRFTPNKYLKGSEKEGDVEELLASHSPTRGQSSALWGRPPVSPRSSSLLRSRSTSPLSSRRAASPVSIASRTSKDWQQEWTAALEHAVDDLEDEKAHRLNTSLDGVMHQNFPHDKFGIRSSGSRAPLKGVHDRPMSLVDSDSGVGSLKARSGNFTAEDFKSSVTPRLIRSRSMSRLNGSLSGETMSLSGSHSLHHSPNSLDKSVREINSALEDSESRRNVLVHKLKEAQTTLELQSERLNKIESAAKENSMLVEDLKFKEREYRKKISQLETAEEDKQRLQMENLRLREEMQDKINTLDYQLRSLKTQHHSSESENVKRITLLDHTTTALTLLEEENTKLQQDKEKLQSEILLLKEAFSLTKTRFGALENDNRNLKNESVRLKEDNAALSKKVQEMAGQMIELRSLLKAVKDENERLSSTWKTSAEDKSRVAKQVEGYQDTITDLRSRLSATSADRDRLFQEKLEMNSKIQQMVLDKEQMMKSKLNLEDQLSEHMSRHSHSKAADAKLDMEQRELARELSSVKKVSEELSAELSSVKSFYERALEQVAALERSKSMWQSQQELAEQEKHRLQSEVDRLTQTLTSRSHDDKREHDYQDEVIHKLRNELKQVRYERNDMESKVQELEAKLAKANEGLREGSALQHSELDTWKNTCDRLTTSVTRKESELQNLTDRCLEMEDTISGLRVEMRTLKDKNNLLSDTEEEVERLRDENRRLLREKAENEQMMKLLETQKSVLTRNSEDNLNRISELERLSGQKDQLRNENDMLRKRTAELERVRDSLVIEKEEALAQCESVYKNPSLEELERKIEELRDANKQLREVNEAMSHKLDAVNQENTKMKQAMGSSLTKVEYERLQEEHKKLQAEFNDLKHEYGTLDAKHQRFVINYGHDGEVAAREKQDLIKLRKEKDAMQKQVTLLQGQMSLMEGSKKRADDQINKLTSEIGELRAQQKQSSNDNGSSQTDSSLRQEVERLKLQLNKAKENQKVQEKMMKNLREDLHEERAKKPRQIQESLEDVSAELQQMRGKLQELMGEIERKEQTIENLETELRNSKDVASAKQQEVQELRKAVEEMEGENQTLRQDVQEIRNTLAAELAEEQEEKSLKRSQSAKSLQEELAEAVKSKKDGSYGKSRIPTAFLSKSLELRPASAPPCPTDPAPQKSATEGSNRLQSLISKYRSHSEKEETGQQRVIKPLPGFVSSKLVSKSRFGATTPKAPMRRGSDPNSPGETPISPLAKQEGVVVTTTKPAKKLPPPPPPKPAIPSSLAAKSTFMRTISGDGTTKDSVTKQSTTVGGGALSSASSLRSTLPSTSSSRSLSSSGLGQSASSGDALNDTQEQKDINALIQKYLKVLET